MKKLIASLLISSMVLVSCGKEDVAETKYFKTYTVSTGVISSKDSLLVTVEGENTTSLSFKNPGRIQDVFVKEGDKVQSGQILATLGNEEAKISTTGAVDILDELQNMGVEVAGIGNDTATLKNAVNNLYDERLNLMNQDVEKAKIAKQMAQKDLDMAKSNLIDMGQVLSGTLLSSDQKIKQAENAYNMSMSNLDNSQKLLELENENLQKNAVNSLTNAYVIALNAKEYLDSILGMTDANKQSNDSFEIYLGAKNNSTKVKAENSFLGFYNQYNKTYNLYTSTIENKTDIPKDVLTLVLQEALGTLESLRNTLHDTMDMLDNSISSSNFDENTLNGMKQQVSTILGNLEQAILSPTALGMVGVKGSIEAMDSFDKNYNLKLKQLQDARDIALQDWNMAKTGKDITKNDNSKNLTSLQTNVSIKEDSLNLAILSEAQALKNIELVKQEKSSKLSEIDAKLGEIQSKMTEVGSKKAEAAMNKSMAQNSIESGIIRAPYDGIVLRKFMDAGTVTGAGTPVFSFTSSDGAYIKTYIDNDIYNTHSGSIVSLVGETNNLTLTGIITTISETKDITNKKNFLEVRLDNRAHIGERYFLQIESEQQEKQIIIPLNSIINKYSSPGVFVEENGIAKFKMITLHESDDKNVAIEGLKIGEKVITDGKDNILDGEQLTHE